ncbi:excinuclease ABC subunit B [Flavobacterium akiainvivens]|uniref:Excinuclease ABC subunit B n=1 Tax=Flavobacterium akiainvivens TaxID=1202724 RepID=A0A0M8MHE4_9FLAO|nr:ABC transporter permease subunit [Flavobacterium akiainvivens]KOS06281.1 excinuclease ABC subunit B [Flavobacterium akiainvivens]SFQ17273.1 ABC-2 family transporter protein [Flavobacterium akiainvivens]
MIRLLSIEFQKLWLNRASRVLIISYFVILSFIALIASIEVDILGIHFKLADQGIFNFPYIWHFNTYVAVWLKGFLAIIIVSMMANEYTYGTLKQNLIDGFSKEEFIKSKILTTVVFALGSTVFIFIMTLLLGYSFSAFDEFSIVFSDMSFLAGYFLNLFGLFSFCLFAGILIKRSAFALGFLFIWFIAEQITKGIVWNTLYRGTPESDGIDTFMGFFPLESFSNLLVEPITRFQAIKSLGTQIDPNNPMFQKDYHMHWYHVTISIFWIGFFMYMSYRILKKRDL